MFRIRSQRRTLTGYTEVCSFAALERAWNEARQSSEREHVTPYLKDAKRFRVKNIVAETEGYAALRWTVDEPADLEVVKRVFEYFYPRIDFSWHEVLALKRERPEWFEDNTHIERDAGAKLGTGQKLWVRAKRIIPGGNSLLSKRSEMFLPDRWPSYFSEAHGCTVTDLDGNRFTDMSYMGIGTNTLGYGHPEVDAAVVEVVRKGNLSTLNCPEEIYLAERLVGLHPWAEMVRYARTGGEANAIAVRIARAASGKDKVAVCGYHGWHDWYLAANLGSGDRLDGHLLPGLEPNGVPRGLANLTVTFRYNQIHELEALVSQGDIGVIIMEVMRNVPPKDGFLTKVRKVASDNGIVLIFDECSSGFRQTFGGLHLEYGIEPDVAMFGKTLGNGYAINAVIGKRNVMECAQSSFISSTFWTERIGPAAALKTLDVMERERSWEQITAIGTDLVRRWRELAATHGLVIETGGLASMGDFRIPGERMLAYKTLLTQEMLKRGYLATPGVYACMAHTPEVLDRYIENLDAVFALFRQCEDGRNVTELLDGSLCHGGFRRLN